MTHALTCPECGSTALGTLEALVGTATGEAIITVDGRRTFKRAGDIYIDYGTSQAIGVICHTCKWSYSGVDPLDQLTPTNDNERDLS